MKAHQVLGEAVRARTTIPYFVLLLKLLVVLASSIGGDRLFRNRFRCADHRPIRIGDERERLVTASPVMTKCRGPNWGRNNYPENGLVNSPRRDTREPSAQPACSEEKLSGAEEQTARAFRAYALCACLLSLQMGL